MSDKVTQNQINQGNWKPTPEDTEEHYVRVVNELNQMQDHINDLECKVRDQKDDLDKGDEVIYALRQKLSIAYDVVKRLIGDHPQREQVLERIKHRGFSDIDTSQIQGDVA